MGIIDASLGRHIARQDRSAKLAELDRLISELQDELDATPDRLWNSPGRVFRHDALIRYSDRRKALLAS
jgi:hypothetical protein